MCNIYGLPSVTIEDVNQLDMLSDRVQNVSINLPEQYIRVELSKQDGNCLLYTSPSPRDMRRYRMPSSA